jgi:hypothetical protein
VAGELVFTVEGASAQRAAPITLSDAGLREREHLQEWVVAHPEVLGPDVKIVTIEFGSWTGHSGATERDRLDVLGLASDGRLVVVELKRDKAPDTVEMQALKYASLVSRFTRDDVDRVHAQFLSQRRGERIDPSTAGAELDEWATITEESLRLPRVVLMASAFPQTVTATVVFLHQQLGLDVQLLAFQAYRTASEVLLTVSQHYPPPEIEEFVLSPEVNEARQLRTEKQTRQREANTVARLLGGDVLDPGEVLEFRAPSETLQAELAAWLDEVPARRHATWQEDAQRPLVWEADGEAYSPTGLTRQILGEGAGRTSSVQGPLYWVNSDGVSLVELAREVPAGVETPIEVHLAKLSPVLRPVFDAADAALMALGEDVTRRSRKSIKYYRLRKLADLLVHGDHLSVYIRGLREAPPDPSGLIVRWEPRRYAHAQVRSLGDVEAVAQLVRVAYEAQA